MSTKSSQVLARRRKRKLTAPPRTAVQIFGFMTIAISIFAVTYGIIHVARKFEMFGHSDGNAPYLLGTARGLAGDPPPGGEEPHGTDDHGTTDDSHAFSLFGGISGLGIYIGTVAVIIIVGAVQLVEYFFHLLHSVTHDTPFHLMVQSIEKELMVVGFTAFVFKIMVDTTSFLDLEWFHALEYADILVPIFSFAYCGLGIMLILNSIRISNLWSQAYHLTLIEMLNSYYNLGGFVGYLPYGLWLAPFYPTIARMEFRIFQSIFCQTYKIQKSAFAFNEYVEKVFEKFILAMIEIRPADWLMLCVLVLLNWARNQLHLDYRRCEVHHDQLCQEENARILFTVSGSIIFALTLLLAVESRRLEVRIMAQKGIRSIHTYPSYLKYMEESEEAKAMDAFRLNKDELKTSAEGVKYSSMHADADDDDDDDDEENPPVGVLSRVKSVFVSSGDGHDGGHGSSKHKKNHANQFSASVKQAWKTKKIVSKMRRKSVTQPGGENRLAVRRTSVMGIGLPGFHFGGGGGGGGAWVAPAPAGSNGAGTAGAGEEEMDGSARLRQFLMSRSPPNIAKVAVIAEEEEEGEGDDSSAASSDSDATEEFNVNAEKDEKNKADKQDETKGENGDTSSSSEGSVTAPTQAETPKVDSSPPSKISPRSRVSVNTAHWKAAPVEPIDGHNGFFHVFSKLQKTSEASRPSNAGGAGAGERVDYEEVYREDSKVSWADTPVRAKQLPPISSSHKDKNNTQNKTNTTNNSERDTSPYRTDKTTTNTSTTNTSQRVDGDVELAPTANNSNNIPGGAGVARAKLPPIKSNTASANSAFSTVAAPVSAKTTASPGRTVGKSLPRPNLNFSPSSGREKTLTNGNNNNSNNSGSSQPRTGSDDSKAETEPATPMSPSAVKYSPTAASAAAAAGGSIKSPLQAPPSPVLPGRNSNISLAGHGEEEEDPMPIVDVFFLSWPELYLQCVQSVIMIISLYYSLYFTNFIAASGSVGWRFVTLAPAVLSSLLLIYIIKCAVMLSAIHAVDCDAILEVLEQTEGARALSALMKEKVMALLNEMGPDPEVELYNLFSEVDSDHSGAISRDEFAEYMNSIEIHFDRRRWMQVFRGIDTTFDNKITFEEFFVFMFPSTSHGKELQEKREKALQGSLAKRSEQRLVDLSKYSNSSARFTYAPVNTTLRHSISHPAATGTTPGAPSSATAGTGPTIATPPSQIARR